MRLAKFLAHAGVASRRASEELIRAGRVTVGEETVRDPARDVTEADVVKIDGARAEPAPETVVYAVHKPMGVVSTASDPQGRPTVVSLVPSPARLYPVGRLDIDSTGLILLTNDGPLAHRLTHPSFEVDKTYVARVARPPVRAPAVLALRRGLTLEDGPTAPARVRLLASDTIELTIHEGRKRQVRRMCEAVGHPVRALQRVGFGPLALGELAPGAHHRLTPAELAELSALSAPAGAGRPRGASSRAAPDGRRRPSRGPGGGRASGAR